MTTLESPSAGSLAIPSASPLSADRIAELRRGFASDPTARLMQNAVTKTKLDDVALDRAIVTSMDHTFSHVLDAWSVTHQKQSGRCWMFAGLNMLRPHAMKQMHLEEFEFSQNHTLFWDKLERANYFLESMIEMADRDVDDRTVAYMLDHPVDDGGQWNMFVSVILKHGLVPKSAMPESESSSCTPRMNSNLTARLRRAARDLRAASADGASAASLAEMKDEAIADVWRILAIHLGTPPERFDWQWKDKDKAFHRDGEMTPKRFAEKYLGVDLREYVCLVHDPRPTSPVGRTFTVDRLGNVIGGDPVVYLNVDIDTMKRIARDLIVERGQPVWMGCDVGKMMSNELGYWDDRLYDYEGVYGVPLEMTKADRLIHHQTLMTHAMLFTGVDVSEGGEIRRWRVENSWGEDRGKKGYYAMNDGWFSEHMFEISAPRDMLSDELRAALDEEPIVLPAWDPMGALAR